MTEKTIKVDYLARVEGEGAMFVKMEEGKVVDLHFKIFEPPRFFEAFLRGRSYRDAPDITSRICGICPVAYQTSAVNAIEDAFGMVIPDPIRELRKLIYCGEWIESHALHVYMLHAPDFLGYESAIHMAPDHPAIVGRGLRLKKIGNDLLALIGGREIHPINPRTGGFFRAPARAELDAMVEDLQWAREAAIATTEWVA
ncbi:MAG: nickel-dependent hydrogenase large subunit, partial [Acidimicrobiia bacterium]|nr:nickel-dependent hydrogenase large subunit [Acidimicrobiia bacterium]